MNLDQPCLTQRELLALSAFKLPAAAVRDLAPSKRALAQAVPGLTAERFRTCERYGLMADCRIKQTAKQVVLCWKPRGRGETRLYTVRDLGTARLVAWMARERDRTGEGLTMREIAVALLQSGVRLFLAMPHADHLLVWTPRSGRQPIGGVVVPARATFELGRGAQSWAFPLAWLGLHGDWKRRLQKARAPHDGKVWRHRWTTVAEIVAQESADGGRAVVSV